jgi:hypothetical protein
MKTFPIQYSPLQARKMNFLTIKGSEQMNAAIVSDAPKLSIFDKYVHF